MPWFGYRIKDGLAHCTENATFYSGAAQTGSRISHLPGPLRVELQMYECLLLSTEPKKRSPEIGQIPPETSCICKTTE